MSTDPTAPKPDPSPVDQRRVERAKAGARRAEQQQRRDAAPQGRRAPDREEA